MKKYRIAEFDGKYWIEMTFDNIHTLISRKWNWRKLEWKTLYDRPTWYELDEKGGIAHAYTKRDVAYYDTLEKAEERLRVFEKGITYRYKGSYIKIQL